MLVFLVFMFTAVPVTELYLLFQAGGVIGVGNTIALVFLTGIVGAVLARSQGFRVMTKLQGELAQGKLPADQFVHGMLVFGGGLLLLTPGFLTDVLGFSMVLPGTRHMIVMSLKSYFKNKIQTQGSVQFYSFGGGGGGFHYQSGQRPPNPFQSLDQESIEVEYRDLNKGDDSN